MATKYVSEENMQAYNAALKAKVEGKVSKEEGKGLSTNDFTNELKQQVTDTAAKVQTLEETGGEANVIESVKVNGVAVVPADKAVDISVPTKTSEIANDSNYQTDTQVSAAIQQAIAASGHAKFVEAEAVPSAETAQENVLYLVMNASAGHYDIYAKVGGEVVLLDDTTVDLSGYMKTADMEPMTTADIDALMADWA